MTTLDERVRIGLDYKFDPSKESQENWEVRVESLVGTIAGGNEIIALLDTAYGRKKAPAVVPTWQNTAMFLTSEEIICGAIETEGEGVDGLINPNVPPASVHPVTRATYAELSEVAIALDLFLFQKLKIMVTGDLLTLLEHTRRPSWMGVAP